ncbi:MAG: oligosaccharide flippase family protein [Erysipelotrichaceae bacterium]
MKKNMIQSTFYLILVSFIAKVLSFTIRIFLARTLSIDAMNYYTLASPTMVMMITLAQMGIPSALSKVIAQEKKHRNSIKAAIFLTLLNNLLLIIFFIIFIPYLSHFILKQVEMKTICYAILPLIPMVSFSGILKGYLLGIQLHDVATRSQVFEELARILFLIFMFYTNPHMDAIWMASIAMISITIGEICSAASMFFYLLKKHSFQYQKHSNYPPLKYYQQILSVSLPMVGSRFIGSFTYFIEPIVMVLFLNATNREIMLDTYGILNGYVLPIITMPSFITITLSNVLLPAFTFHYTRGNIKRAKKLFNIILILCFMIGITTAFLCFNYSEPLLMFLYKKQLGSNLLKIMAWPFAFYAIQPVLSAMLHALSFSNKAMLDTFLGSLLRILLVAFTTVYLKVISLPLAMCLGMMLTTILHAYHISIAFYHDR